MLVDRLKIDTNSLMLEGDRAMAAMLRSPTILVAGGLSAEQVIDPRRWRDLQENPDENQVPGPKRAPLTPKSRKNSRL